MPYLFSASMGVSVCPRSSAQALRLLGSSSPPLVSARNSQRNVRHQLACGQPLEVVLPRLRDFRAHCPTACRVIPNRPAIRVCVPKYATLLTFSCREHNPCVTHCNNYFGKKY